MGFINRNPALPLLVVSPYTKPGHISHAYAHHVSTLKFIERNWHLNTITGRGRDNLANPVSTVVNPYVPTNSPAVTEPPDELPDIDPLPRYQSRNFLAVSF